MGENVDVWLAPLGRSGDESILSPDERERAARFGLERPRRTYVNARIALREILAGHLGREPAAIRFAYSERGKPGLDPAGGDLAFNLSHSGDLAVIAVASGRRVGVDIERAERGRRAARIARRRFAAPEADAIEALPARAREDAFLRVWTAKEAYAKALGEGLAIALDSFEVAIEPLGVVRPAPQARGVVFALQAVEGVPGYCATVAAEGEGWVLRPRTWTPG